MHAAMKICLPKIKEIIQSLVQMLNCDTHRKLLGQVDKFWWFLKAFSNTKTASHTHLWAIIPYQNLKCEYIKYGIS